MFKGIFRPKIFSPNTREKYTKVAVQIPGHMLQGATGVPFPVLRDRIPKVANKAAGQDVQIVIPPINIVTKQRETNKLIKKSKRIRCKTVLVKESSINIISTNARDLKYKEEDLKNMFEYLKSSIFAVQETHYKRKGKFKFQDFKIFEAIRKNKEGGGGSMLGIHVGLQPVLVAEYCEHFELIVVEIQAGKKDICVITGYGPQKNWDDKDRLPFYTALEKEVASAEIEGKSVIMAMDTNAKFRPTYIPNDPKDMSGNGKVLAAIIERHALFVVNGLKDKSKGLFTREMSTINGVEIMSRQRKEQT